VHYKKAAELRRGGRELVACGSDYFRRYLEAEEGQAAAEKYPHGGSLRWRGGAKNLRPKRRNIRVAPLVYTGAVRYAAALGEIQKKPRGGSRGAMTRSLSGR
jgi:hypothetical protein